MSCNLFEYYPANIGFAAINGVLHGSPYALLSATFSNDNCEINMKHSIGMLVFAICIAPAVAEAGAPSVAASCESLQTAIRQRGAVVIHYSSPRGVPLFDRFVDGPDRCPSKLTERLALNSAGGRPCQLQVCDPSNDLRP